MKNVKDKIKSINGITLIALIITIVVLIILAGVSMSIMLNDGGILKKAQQAKQEYLSAQEKEETEIAKTTNDINNYVSSTRDNSYISYSTEEQDTGLKWIDGKLIYQKTISCGGLKNNQQISVPHNVSNIDHVIDYKMIAWNNSTGVSINDAYYDVLYPTYSVRCSANKTSCEIRTGADMTQYSASYMTIQYTKTTDTAE